LLVDILVASLTFGFLDIISGISSFLVIISLLNLAKRFHEFLLEIRK
jgi:hypothetical protein